MDDLYLKIIAKEIPSSCVYEDAETIAFLDINPCTKGHTLVVPKKFTRNLMTMTGAEFGYLMETVHRVAHAVIRATNADGVNLIMNNEAAAGQEVFHAHVHIIPRHTGDSVFTPPTYETYADGEKTLYAEKIKAAL